MFNPTPTSRFIHTHTQKKTRKYWRLHCYFSVCYMRAGKQRAEINVITEMIDLVVIGWERHFYQVTGFREVVIGGVSREHLRRGLVAGSRGFIIMMLTAHKADKCLLAVSYWYLLIVGLNRRCPKLISIQMNNAANSSRRDSSGRNPLIKVQTFKRHSLPSHLSFSFSSFSLPVFPRLPPPSAPVVTGWKAFFVFLPLRSSIFYGNPWADERSHRDVGTIFRAEFSVFTTVVIEL